MLSSLSIRRAAAPQPALGSPARLMPLDRRSRRVIEHVVDLSPIRSVHLGAYLQAGTAPLGGVGLWGITLGDEVIGGLQRCRGISWAIEPRLESDPRILEGLGEFVARWTSDQDVVFGPEAQVLQVLRTSAVHGVHPVEVRRQTMMEFDPDSAQLPQLPPPFTLRAARRGDVPWLLRAHADMCREDLGVDQVARNPAGYRRYFEDLVAAGQCYVGEADGTAVFKAEIPLISRQAWLIEGVFTVPAARGRGYASAATGQLASLATRRGRRACLYAHIRNVRAIEIYRRLGFLEDTRWTTVIVGRAARRSGEPALW